MLKHSLLLLSLLCTSGLALQAQTGIENSNVTVVSTFEARLTDAERVQVTPVPPRPDTLIVRQQYLVVDQPLSLEYPAPVIRPRGIGRQEAPPVKNGYVSIGLGVPNAFYGDLSYDLSGVDNAELGIYAKHYSFNNNGNVENQKASDTEVGVQGTYLFDQGFAVEGGLGYETYSRYYYGYNFAELADGEEPLSFEDDDVRQRFGIFKVNADIFNGTKTVADIDYKAGFSAYIMDGDPTVRERNIDLHVGATKWISEDQPLDLLVRADFTTFDDTSKQTLNNFFFSPSYTTSIAGRYRLKVGLHLTAQEDDFDVFPNFSFHAPVVDGTLSAFVGWEGTLQNNSLYNLVDYNPWVSTRLRVKTAEYWRVYGGVDGTFSGIGYRLEAGYKNIDNLATYNLNYRRDIPRFDVVYDDATVVTLQASATVEPIEALRVNGSIAQRFYSMENLESPYHLPAFTLNLGAAYSLLEGRLTTGADFYVENGLPYLNAAGDEDNLNGLFDLSLNGSYAFNETFSGWVRVNNLLNNKRERFAQYPTIGTNFLIGASAAF